MYSVDLEQWTTAFTVGAAIAVVSVVGAGALVPRVLRNRSDAPAH